MTISVGSVYEYLNNPSESVTAKAYKEHIYNTGGADLLSAEELLENYNMRIISFEYQSSNH
ncbi:MAG: hypothetical protein IJ333_08745 [Clostridia bacterium]|nr:hypothetical protein [Clostridia bacterium]